MRIKTITGMLALSFAMLLVGVFGGSPPGTQAASAAGSSVERSTPATATVERSSVTIEKAIFQERGICNVADRVTATVARFRPPVLTTPEVPTFEIAHVPIVA
jgi:hypothetical protein